MICEEKTANSPVDTLQKIIAVQRDRISHLERILSQLPGHIYWKDRKGIYLGSNDQQALSLGLKSGTDIVGKIDSELPWHRNSTQEFEKNDHEVLQHGKLIISEENALFDGKPAIVLSYKAPLRDKDNNITGILGLSIDITKHKKNQQELTDLKKNVALSKVKIKEKNSAIHDLEYILSKMPAYVYWKNIKSEYVGCNDQLAKFSNLSSPLDIVGKTDYDFEWGKNQADQFIKDDKFIMETGQNLVTEYELPQKKEDGENLYVSTDKMPFYDQNGKIIGVLAIAFDITNQKALEKKILEEKEKAEKANLIKTEFMRNMEHDIRTPFSGICGMAEYLWETETNKLRKEYLGDITQCAKELLEYCNSILDFSKIESGMLTITNKKLNLERLVNSAIKIGLPIATHKKLQLKVNYDKRIPSVVLGDRYRLDRILINLLGNAIKFTEKGFVELKTILIKKTPKSALVRFIIKDTGIGIPSEKQEYIFEKFSRLSLSNKGLYKGIGLGLRITKQFMHELNGEIDLISGLGKGTQFICTISFDLPLTNDFVEE